MSDTVTPRLGCAHFHNDDPRREVWTGKYRAITALPHHLIDSDTERIWLIK